MFSNTSICGKDGVSSGKTMPMFRRSGARSVTSSAAQKDPAARRLDETRDHAQGRRLAAAGRSEQRKEFALLDMQIRIGDRNGVAIGLGQADQPHIRHWMDSLWWEDAAAAASSFGLAGEDVVDRLDDLHLVFDEPAPVGDPESFGAVSRVLHAGIGEIGGHDGRRDVSAAARRPHRTW